MAIMKFEIDRKLSRRESSGVIYISSADLQLRCVYSEDKDVKIFAFHKIHNPSQRSTLGTEVNSELVKGWVAYHYAKKNGASEMNLGELIPSGQIVLGTINSATLAKTKKFALVDGQQRLATLKVAEGIVGEPIEVILPVHFIEKSTPEELAGHYMKFNTCNPMGKGDFVAGAICTGNLSEFVDKVDTVRQSGTLGGCNIGLRPSRDERIGRHTFGYHQVLTWLCYALYNKTNKTFMIKVANNISLLAVERVCKILATHDQILGYKNFRAKTRNFHYCCYSSDAFMGAICRLALVEELNGDGWLNDEAVSFWFNELANTGHENGVATLGQKWWEYATHNRAGGGGAKSDIYESFLRHPADNPNRLVKKMGIAIAQPNQRYRTKYAKAGFGHSPEDGRIYEDNQTDD